MVHSAGQQRADTSRSDASSFSQLLDTGNRRPSLQVMHNLRLGLSKMLPTSARQTHDQRVRRCFSAASNRTRARGNAASQTQREERLLHITAEGPSDLYLPPISTCCGISAETTPCELPVRSLVTPVCTYVPRRESQRQQ